MSVIPDPSIFREYDIRGIVGKTLNESTAHAVGKAFGTILKRRGGKKLGLCYDGRHSSPALSNALIDGVLSTGITVENYGLGPTPLVYFAIGHRSLDAAIAITGSHNPPDYNGIKMSFSDGPFYGQQIKDLETLIKQQDFETGTAQATSISLYDDYIDRLTSDYKPQGKPPLKIAWDAGNGAAGAVLKQLTDKLPGEHILLFDDVDGDFPNHHPDPAEEENLEDLRDAVQEHGCDLGIAFDGDGDRIGVIDRNGTIIWGDQLVALYARDVLTREPNAQILIDIKCSQTIYTLIQEWGGRPMFWKCGHSLMKAKMVETGAAMGGELSGHIYIKEGFSGHDDGLYCAIRLLNVIHAFGDLTELRKDFPTVYNTPEIRFEVPPGTKFDTIETVKNNVAQLDGVDVLDIDGVRVKSTEGWFLIRASNTQSVLTIRAESKTEAGLKTVVNDLAHQLEKTGVTPPKELDVF